MLAQLGKKLLLAQIVDGQARRFPLALPFAPPGHFGLRQILRDQQRPFLHGEVGIVHGGAEGFLNLILLGFPDPVEKIFALEHMDRFAVIPDHDVDPAVALRRANWMDRLTGVFLHQQRETDLFKFFSRASVPIFALQVSEIPFHLCHILSGDTIIISSIFAGCSVLILSAFFVSVNRIRQVLRTDRAQKRTGRFPAARVRAALFLSIAEGRVSNITNISANKAGTIRL